MYICFLRAKPKVDCPAHIQLFLLYYIVIIPTPLPNPIIVLARRNMFFEPCAFMSCLGMEQFAFSRFGRSHLPITAVENILSRYARHNNHRDRSRTQHATTLPPTRPLPKPPRQDYSNRTPHRHIPPFAKSPNLHRHIPFVANLPAPPPSPTTAHPRTTSPATLHLLQHLSLRFTPPHSSHRLRYASSVSAPIATLHFAR